MSADPLLALIRAVPMRCADCGDTTTTTRDCPNGLITGLHTFVTDDAAIVRAVRAWLREREPTHEQITRAMYKNAADAVRALYRRAWGEPE